ncbi:MAG: phage holin family protein [Actinomycetes bacterium]
MPKFLIAWLLGLGSNAIALALCAVLFSQFHLNLSGFLLSLVVFAILSGVFTWFVLKFMLRHAGSVVALTGLVSTFLALLATSVFTKGLEIDGITTWIMSTLLIWIISMFIWVIPGPWRNSRRDRAPRVP